MPGPVPRPDKRKVTVSATVLPATSAAMKAAADKKGVTVSAYIGTILERHRHV